MKWNSTDDRYSSPKLGNTVTTSFVLIHAESFMPSQQLCIYDYEELITSACTSTVSVGAIVQWPTCGQCTLCRFVACMV